MAALKNITIHGFKTIRELDDFELRPLNVLIGSNGAGKSNFISFFRMMSWMLGPPGELQTHIAQLGGAQAILHDGSAVTPQIEAELEFGTQRGSNEYAFRLFHAAGDTLIFADERYRFSDSTFPQKAEWATLESGHREANLIQKAEMGDPTAKFILSLLRKCVVYQFHNTSHTSRIRNKWSISDNQWLKEDGANLAPFLLNLREHHSEYYHRIVEILRTIAPFFADFELKSDYGRVLLQWRERNSDILFDASQASDGMLRIFSLVALLAQPRENLPGILILDEPELGLYPYAIDVSLCYRCY